jgi:hypothetical protein
MPAYIMVFLWRKLWTPSSRSCRQLLLTRALLGARSEAIDMFGLSRSFLTLLIATVALHASGLAWADAAKDRWEIQETQNSRKCLFAGARTGWVVGDETAGPTGSRRRRDR